MIHHYVYIVISFLFCLSFCLWAISLWLWMGSILALFWVCFGSAGLKSGLANFYLHAVEITLVELKHSSFKFTEGWSEFFLSISNRLVISSSVTLHLFQHLFFISQLLFLVFETNEGFTLNFVSPWFNFLPFLSIWLSFSFLSPAVPHTICRASAVVFLSWPPILPASSL